MKPTTYEELSYLSVDELERLTVAKRILAGILADLTDRRGLRHEWYGIDDEIQDEIVQAWESIINRELEKSA